MNNRESLAAGVSLMNVDIAVTDAQVEACYPVMRELRPRLDAPTFVEIVRDMQRDGMYWLF